MKQGDMFVDPEDGIVFKYIKKLSRYNHAIEYVYVPKSKRGFGSAYVGNNYLKKCVKVFPVER